MFAFACESIMKTNDLVSENLSFLMLHLEDFESYLYHVLGPNRIILQ